MLESLLRHQQQLNVVPTVIARFLDVRCSRDVDSADYRSDEHVVLTVLASAQYSTPSANVSAVEDSMCETADIDEDDELFGRRVEQAAPPHGQEVYRFGLLPQASKDVDIISWWISHRLEYPKLYQVAMDYLAIPASSVASERANSVAKMVFHGRESLSDDMFKIEMCCKSWLALAEALAYELPTDFLDAYNELRQTTDIESLGQSDPAVLYALQNL
jgi:hypothetical protein